MDEQSAVAAGHYAAGEYALAADAYGRAIDCCSSSDGRLAILFSNRAAARLHLEQFSFAAHDAALALSLDPSLWKASLRRAKALLAMDRATEAADAVRALLQGSLPAERACEAADLLRTAREHASTPAAEGPSRMVLPHQTLRVQFSSLPEQLEPGRWHTVALRLSNEMGLFDASVFSAAAEAAVQLRLLPLGGGGEATGALRVRQALVGTDAPSLVDTGRAICLRGGSAVAEVKLPSRLPAGGGESARVAPVATLWAELLDGDGCTATEADGSADAGAGGDGGGAVGCRAGVARPLDVLGVMSVAIPLAEWCTDAAASVGATTGGCTDGAPTAAPLAAGGGAHFPTEAQAASLRRALLGPHAAGGEAEAAGAGRGEPSLLQCLRLVGAGAGCSLVVGESASGICGRVWDSALVLGRWLCRAQAELSGVRALELGAGSGLAGIVAASLGARVLLTDLEEALPLLELNAAANAPLCDAAPTAAPLEWGDAELHPACASFVSPAAPGTRQPPLWLLCSDVVYAPEAYAPLLATLRRLAPDAASARIVMAHRSRHPDENDFWRPARREFDVAVLQGGAFRPLGSPPEEAEVPGAADGVEGPRHGRPDGPDAATRGAAAGDAAVRVLELRRR